MEYIKAQAQVQLDLYISDQEQIFIGLEKDYSSK